jgi:pilus assembly protein CpaC
MSERHPMKRFAALSLSALMALSPLAVPVVVHAQTVSSQGVQRTIMVPKDKSMAFHLDYAASQIVVSQPDTLELVATTDRSFYVRGKAIGSTNILIYDMQHRLAQVVDVHVGYDTDALEADMRTALPGEEIHAANVAGGILLTGDVSTSGAALRARALAERYAPAQVQSQMTIRQAQQVQVEVRVMEVSRTALRDLGLNIAINNANGRFGLNTGNGLAGSGTPQGAISFGTNIGNTSISATLQALEQRGALRTLAQPTLIAMSGQQASFLAGGEFPFPIPDGNNGVTIQFRTFGVKLEMTPTVQDSGEIRLQVAPEVSQLDPRNGVRLGGIEIPSLTTRRASTTVELRDGESFAIAGLFQQDYMNQVNQLPGAGNVPVLGALFRSASWRRQETELVIIVTPHLTTPSSSQAELPNPLRDADEPGEIDLILQGHSTHTPMPPTGRVPHGGLFQAPGPSSSVAQPPAAISTAPADATAQAPAGPAPMPAAMPLATAAQPATTASGTDAAVVGMAETTAPAGAPAVYYTAAQ